MQAPETDVPVTSLYELQHEISVQQTKAMAFMGKSPL